MEQERSVAMSKATKRVLDLFESTGMGVVPFERMLKLTEGTIKNLKNGRNNASADTICRVAEYFNVSVDYIVGYTDFPKCPTSWWILRRTLITAEKDIAFLSRETGLPLEVFSNWELGNEPDEKTLQLICDTLKLKVNPFKQTKKAAQSERLDTTMSIKESESLPAIFGEMSDILKDKAFVDTAKLFNSVSLEMRSVVFGVILGAMQALKVDTKKILGY